MTIKKDWIALGVDEATDRKVVVQFIKELSELGLIKTDENRSDVGMGNFEGAWDFYRKGLL